MPAERLPRPSSSVCVHCGVAIELDTEVLKWTNGRNVVWFDPDVVDGSPDGRNDGRRCGDGAHEPEPDEAEIAEGRLQSRDYEAWAAL